MYGYHGKAMVVDLTSGDVRWEPLHEDILRRFIGGVGLGTYLLYKHCPAGIDPLEPANPLIFVTSPLVGSRLTTSSKFAVVTKSPLTGFIGDSLSTSFLALELKKVGCDALVITGRSASPTVLSVTDSGVEFLDGRHLLGLGISETEERVKAQMGGGTRVACIGPAGEKLVRYATISNDGGRQTGRTGPGAVMGSKNLKAIALRGRLMAPVFDREALNVFGKDLARRSQGPATEKYRELGTLANVSVFNRLGTLPTRNFQQSTFEEAERLSGEVFHQFHQVNNTRCLNCTIGCKHIFTTTDNGTRSLGRLEYQSSYALGPLVGVGDANTVIRASHLCDELGMDTISAGATIAWALECFDRGIFTSEDTGGLDLSFGNGDALLASLRLIAERHGLGDLLAEGSRLAAKAVGHGSEEWAMHVKGLEMPGYEPRSLKTMALGLAVATRGACHNRSSAYEADFSSRVDRLKVDDERGRIIMEGEDFSSVMDSISWCKFLRKAFDDFYQESVDAYRHVTGWPMNPADLRLTGERISNLKKLFNIREGWTREDDTLPPRILQEKLPTGIVKGVGLTRDDLNMMIGDYYRARGWTEDGLVPDGKMRELGLEDVVEAPVVAV